MGYKEVISAKVEVAMTGGKDTNAKMRLVRLGLSNDIFRGLEAAAQELDDARRHAGAARASAADGDESGLEFDQLRQTLARRAAARELANAACAFHALIRMSIGRAESISSLTDGLSVEDASWLASVIGAGL